MLRRVLAIILSAALFAGCTGGAADETTTSATSAAPATTTTVATSAVDSGFRWWNDRVFYEIFVRSFKDSNGDGVGDFVGLTESLDYLNDGDPSTTEDLGITGIWLMPIFPSPSYHGYDVTDYRTVNPDYGTMEEFETFLDAAHQRGIAVIIDLVINHTSSQHPWFEASRSGDPSYRDWYLWSDTDPATTGPWGQDVWHQSGDDYYFGLFWEGMPDLNLENSAVRDEIYDIARFWVADVGVDGFRLDAARHLIEEGAVMADTPSTVAWLQDFTAYVHEVAPEALVLGEIWSPTLEIAAYVPDAVDLAFEFALSEAGGAATATGDAAVLEGAMERVAGAYPEGQFAPFLTNHDQDRIMSVVGGDVALAKLAAAWLLTSPGVPFVYYGEEVGLEGTKPDERIRTPMPWTGDAPGVGFTTGTPWEPIDAGYAEHNVAVQGDDPGSLLSVYRDLIHLRNDSSGLRYGDVIEVETGTSGVFAFLRSDGEDHVLVVGNITDAAVPVTLDLAEGPLAGMKGVITVVGPGATPPAITEKGGFLEYHPVDSLPAYGALVLRFSAEEQPAPPATTSTTTTTAAATATEEDAEIAEAFMSGLATEDLLSPDFRVRYGDQTWGWDDDLAALGIDDWNGDGRRTLADNLAAEVTSERVFRLEYTIGCVPAVDVVECEVVAEDLFHRRAGIAPPPERRALRIEDGLVVEMQIFDVEPSADWELVGRKWSEQFLVFEQWVADTYPERYGTIFSGECCAGDGSNWIFTPDTVDEWEALLTEWAPPDAG